MKYLLLLAIAFALSSCAVSYKASDIQNCVNKNLPKKVDMKIADLNVKKLSNVKMNEKDQRIHFSFECVVENRIKNFECSNFRVSAKPALKDGKVIMTDIKADDVSCGVPLTDLINWVKNYFLKEIDVVKLSGMEQKLVKKIYIQGEEIRVRVSVI